MEPALDEPAARLVGAITACAGIAWTRSRRLYGVGVEGAGQPFLDPDKL